MPVARSIDSLCPGTTGKLTHQLLFQALNFLNVIASGLMMWKALCLFTNSDSPIVVVLS